MRRSLATTRGLRALAILGTLAACSGETPGIDLYARNTTAQPLWLSMTAVPTPGPRAAVASPQHFALSLPPDRSIQHLGRDLPVTPFDITVTLSATEHSPSLTSLQGTWPGKAGTSASAGSTRIAVEVAVRPGETGPTLSFEGLI